LNPHFEAFIPIGCLTHPITNRNWEGLGVIPDFPVSSERALIIAHKMALKSIIQALGDPQSEPLRVLLVEAKVAYEELADK